MSSIEAVSPVQTPADFARISGSYRLRVWMAMLGLILFVLLYIGLAGFFTYLAYQMIAGIFAGGDNAVGAFFAALPPAFLAIFMWKALFFVRHGASNPGIEITPHLQPELFLFLHELADEVGAPRPHRVFLSPNVNASVFYDLSILNFFLPSKKNLMIGLGLVNVLTRSELKAVLAHEFGHFAQRSMAVGRWVYVGEQIAGHIIAKRDVLDKTLDFISRIDLRVAWIGWIMRTIVWSIRSLMETVFRWVVIAHRALSREMEFQADLVAVSCTGSDPLINALYRLQPADEDWERSLNFAETQMGKGRIINDMFEVQTLIGEHMRRVLNEPMHGKVPELPSGNPAAHRLFTEQIAQPPRMWSTHPPNTEREENAKRTYISAPLERESAWTLFESPRQLREEVTRFLFETVKFEKSPEVMSSAEVRAALDEQFSHESYDTRYRGAYLGRPVTISSATVAGLYGEPPVRDELAQSLGELYPDNLHDSLKNWRNLEEEIALLKAIEDGIYDAPEGVIRHRGEVVPRTELSELIERVEQERDDTLSEIEQHDRKCRTVHGAAAKEINQGWDAYLEGLAKLLHYVEHSERDLNDAHGHLANITRMATAAGRVSSAKLKRVLASANDLHGVMVRLDRQAGEVVLPEAILHDLDLDSWRSAYSKLELPPATEHNIGQWMDVIESWAMPMIYRYAALRRAVLAELLKSERYVASLYQGEAEPQPAPPPPANPEEYTTRTRGTERIRQKKLDWWSRFTLADGTGPAVLRFVSASAIVAAVVIAGLFVGSVNVVVYNGLSTPVNVTIDEHEVSVQPFQRRTVSVGTRLKGTVTARTVDGREIESFDVGLQKAFANYVYNVAGAAPMVEWIVSYGFDNNDEPEFLGCPRWRTTKAWYIFEQPPQVLETSSGGTTRRVLGSESTLPPQFILSMVKDQNEKERVIRTHAKWDAPTGRYIAHWLTLAQDLSGFGEIIEERLKVDPHDVATLRSQQDAADADQKEQIRKRHRELARQHPDDPDWQYIGIRAMTDGPEQDQAFLDAFRKWPDNVWLAISAGHVHTLHADWEQALAAFDTALKQQGPVYDSAAVRVARIRRLLATDEPPNLRDLQPSIEVSQLLALETGAGMQQSPAYAYSLLNQGKLQQAYQTAGTTQADPHTLILLAASRGAEPEWQQRALKLPIDQIQNAYLLLYLAALAHRHGEPCDPYFSAFEKVYPQDRKSPLDYMKQFLADGQPPATLAADITDLGPESRGLVLAIAMVMYPEHAQEEWKRIANALLFSVERPVF